MSTPAAPSPDRSAGATAIGLIAVLLWSASVGLIRSVSELLGPTGGAAAIFSVAGGLATMVLGLPSWRRLQRADLAYLLPCGAVFVAYEICLALSLGLAANRPQALELAMINYLWPSLTIAFAVLARLERATRWLLPGMALSFAGIAWVMKGEGLWSLQALVSNAGSNPMAYGLAFAAAGLWALYSVLTRRLARGASPVPLFLLATAAVLWLKYALGDDPALRFSTSALLQVLLLGACMAAAYSCWNHGIQHGHLALLATASYFTPALSVLLASAWLGVQPGGGFWQGVAMVTGGSLLCWRATRGSRR